MRCTMKWKNSQISVIERFCSRPNRFSNKKFEIFTFQTSNINSDHDQTERMQTDCLPAPISFTARLRPYTTTMTSHKLFIAIVLLGVLAPNHGSKEG